MVVYKSHDVPLHSRLPIKYSHHIPILFSVKKSMIFPNCLPSTGWFSRFRPRGHDLSWCPGGPWWGPWSMKAMFHEKLDGFVGDIHHSPNIRASTPSLIPVKKIRTYMDTATPKRRRSKTTLRWWYLVRVDVLQVNMYINYVVVRAYILLIKQCKYNIYIYTFFWI